MMVIDLSNMSISKDWNYDERNDKVFNVCIDFDAKDLYYDPDIYSSGWQFLQFSCIDNVKAFILELWEVAKDAWPNERN